MMDGHESNSFDKLPDEVLQLIFALIGDCKSLVHCMVVSKAFQGQASKVSALKITCPRQFSTYDQKLWNIYLMVKTFKALESLIVCIGQPKNEPPASWARCMRYAEIGLAVEKFVFMAAKSGDFVEFDFALGLRSQLANDNVNKFEDGFISNNEQEVTTFKNINEDKVARGMLVNDEIAFFGGEKNDGERSNINMNVLSSTSRQEPSTLRNTNLTSISKSGLYTIRTIDSITANDMLLTSHYNVEETSNTDITPHSKNNLEYKKGESSERFGAQDHIEGQMSLGRNGFNFPRQPHFNQENLHVPIINFHLKQVIAPSNDVLKRMVPVIVFAIVQGLDEFRDTIPNFIEKFVKLKRFVLVDIVESVTIHMREHQIQQVRTQRLETISKLISESVALKNNFKTNIKSDKAPIDGVKFSNRDKNEIGQGDQSNESEHRNEYKHLDVDKDAQDFSKVGGITNAPLQLQIHEIRSKISNSNPKNKPSMFKSGFHEERTFQEKNTIDKPQTSKLSNQIIKLPMSNNVCDACQDCKIEGNVGICWHRFPNGLSNFVPSISYVKKNTLDCELPPLPHVEQLIGNWSCNDPSLKAWLKGKHSLAGPEDISQISHMEIKQVESISKDYKKTTNSIQARSFEEIMACRIRDDFSIQLPNTPIIPNSKKINKVTFNQIILNSHVTFSNNKNLGSMRRNVGQTSLGPTTSIMKKSENFRNFNTSEIPSEDFEHIDEVIEEEELELDFWKKPSHFQEGSKSSSMSLNGSRSENPSSNFELHRIPIHQTKLHEKKNISFEKRKCLNDLSSNSKTHRLKYKSSQRKYAALKDTNSKFSGKHLFKRGLRKEASRRREGDRASRIANSRRCGKNGQSKNDVWMEGGWPKQGRIENVPFLQDGGRNPKDFWKLINKAKDFRNKSDDDITLDSSKDGQENLGDIKGKMVAIESSNDEERMSSSEMRFKIHNEILDNEQVDVINYNNANNNIVNITTTHEDEQFSHIALNNNKQLISTSFEGVVLVPYESNATIVNDQLQGSCDLKDINSQSLTPFHNTNFINIQDYSRIEYTPGLNPSDDDHMRHSEVAWLGARAKERSTTRSLGRRARSLRRENHAHAEREREARRERICEGIQKRQRDIEQEALFFDISFWRSEQVATQNYVLSEVSMCIATHNAKPLSEEELEMLSTVALAGPLLAATIAYVNEQIGSHNL